MDQNSSSYFSKDNVLIIIFYFLFAIVLSPYHKYSLDLTDTFQYLVIAENYSKGNFSDAINSYWSPLFSWILAILIKLGIEPFTAIQILQIFIGSISLLGVLKLIPFKNENRSMFLLLHFSFLILILSFALLVATPDLLLLTITIWYLVFISRKEYYLNNTYSFLLFGVMGALLYFAKGAGFFVFLLSFTLINCLFFFRKDSTRTKIASKYLSTLLVFFVLSSCWIFIISKKENKFLISSAAEYNFKLIGPSSNPYVLDEIVQPPERIGLITPPKNSLSAWEQPHKMIVEKWSPLHSRGNFIHYIKIILKNLWSIQSFYFGLDAGTILILGLFVVWINKGIEIKKIVDKNNPAIIVSIACTIPYIFLLVMDRYIWVNTITIGILAVSVFTALTTINKKISILFFLLFICAIGYKPLKGLLNFNNQYISMFQDKEKFQGYISGNVASLVTNDEKKEENYAKSTMLSYLSDNKYYGMIKVPEQSNIVVNQLKKYNIKYLLSWNKSSQIPDSIYSENIFFRKSRVTVYKLK